MKSRAFQKKLIWLAVLTVSTAVIALNSCNGGGADDPAVSSTGETTVSVLETGSVEGSTDHEDSETTAPAESIPGKTEAITEDDTEYQSGGDVPVASGTPQNTSRTESTSTAATVKPATTTTSATSKAESTVPKAESGSAAESTVTKDHETTDDPLSEFKILSTEEKGDVIAVATSYLNFEYPSAFIDVIKFDSSVTAKGTALEFKAMIDGAEYPIYTIRFGDETGHEVGTIRLGRNPKDYSVYVEFYEIKGSFGEDAKATFYAAQETFNDVAFSFEDNSNFTSAFAK